MKAIVHTAGASPAEALQAVERAVPTLRANEVLVRVKAAALSAGDTAGFARDERGRAPLAARFAGLIGRGTVPGGELAGIVEAVGADVAHLRPGDEVLACTGTSGAWAECVAVDARLACRKPARLSFEQAAALPVGGITALGAVRKAEVEAGQRVLVYGSSGGVGLFAVQCAKAAGAHVTGVCSTRNLEAARMAGAERVIDYTQDDFAQAEGRYNVIIGANGCNPLGVYRRLLAAGGTYVAVGDVNQGMAGLAGPVRSLGSSKRLTWFAFPFAPQASLLAEVTALAAAGAVTPFVEAVYPLSAAADAVAHVARHHAQGKTVLVNDFSRP